MSARPNLSFSRIPLAVWVFFGAFLIQFLVLQSIANTRYFLPESDDMKFYNDWALRIAGGQWSDGKAFYGMPGFAYALAAIYTLTGGYNHDYSPFLIGQFNAAMHALTATFIFLIGRRIFGSERRGLTLSLTAVAVWLALTPAQVFTAILMPTSWVICGYWGTAYFLLRTWQEGKPKQPFAWLLAGIATGLIASTVATILMLLPLAILCIALTSRGVKQRVIAVLAALAGAFAVSSAFSAAFDFSATRAITAAVALGSVGVLYSLQRDSIQTAIRAALLLAGVYLATSPVWLHNRIVAKDNVFLSAHDGLNFYVGNHAEANGYTKIPSTMSSSQEGMLRDSELIPQAEAGRAMKRSEISAYWKAKANAYIRDNPGDWLQLLGRKFANFWNVYQYDDLSIIKLLRDEGAVPPGFRFGFIAALGLAGLPFCWMRWPASRWIIGAVALHVFSLMPVFITERYRLAAAPGLILLGIGGLAILQESLASSKMGRVAISIAALVAAAAFCTLSRADAGWALDYYKAGIRATQTSMLAKAQGNPIASQAALERAQRNLETAYAYVNGNADLVFAMGNLWMEKGDPARAERCYLRAVAISASVNPARVHDGALTNLGMIAANRGAWAEAERYFLESLHFDPADAKTWFSLAEAREKSGNLTGAREAALRAQTLRPGHPDIEAIVRKLPAGNP
ncbi:MAG: hypothetical protein RL088_3927 [Verrucomicrobiota bacterium]|jgi:Flp pilus assembly protein TadD